MCHLAKPTLTCILELQNFRNTERVTIRHHKLSSMFVMNYFSSFDFSLLIQPLLITAASHLVEPQAGQAQKQPKQSSSRQSQRFIPLKIRRPWLLQILLFAGITCLSEPAVAFQVSLLFSLLPVSGANSVCFPGFANCNDLKALAVLP